MQVLEVKALIGYFDLDPNRAVALALQAFASQPVNKAYLPLFRLFVPDSVGQTLGFLFQHAQAAGDTPDSLFAVAVALMQARPPLTQSSASCNKIIGTDPAPCRHSSCITQHSMIADHLPVHGARCCPQHYAPYPVHFVAIMVESLANQLIPISSAVAHGPPHSAHHIDSCSSADEMFQHRQSGQTAEQTLQTLTYRELIWRYCTCRASDPHEHRSNTLSEGRLQRIKCVYAQP